MQKHHIGTDDKAILAELLREAIGRDRFPLSTRVRRWRAVLAKLDPPPTGASELLPRPKAWVNSSIGQRKRRR